MAKLMLDRKPDVAAWLGIPLEELRYIFVFANTGMEHDDTLRFVHDIDRRFGLDLVWLEAVVHPAYRKGTTHRVTDYKRAYRQRQWRDPKHPFHAFIRKYGIPNLAWHGCTREMKFRVLTSYMRSLGLSPGDYYSAIGIRDDESRRVSTGQEAEKFRFIYPLVHLEATDKDDVLEWWSQFPWDLAIEEHLGNCVGCHKKSFKKLARVYEDLPGAFDFNLAMEQRYGKVGPEFERDPENPPRVFFRQNRSTKTMLRLFEDADVDHAKNLMRQQDAGCSESCEVFPTEDPRD